MPVAATHTHADLVNLAADYLRKVQHCDPVTAESMDYPESPDAIGWCEPLKNKLVSHVVECKASVSDWREGEKRKRRERRLGVHRWVMCPAEMILQFEAEAHGYGLLWVDGGEIQPIHDAPERRDVDLIGERWLLWKITRRQGFAGKVDDLRKSRADKLTEAQTKIVMPYLAKAPGTRAARLKKLIGFKGGDAKFIRACQEHPRIEVSQTIPTTLTLKDEIQ